MNSVVRATPLCELVSLLPSATWGAGAHNYGLTHVCGVSLEDLEEDFYRFSFCGSGMLGEIFGEGRRRCCMRESLG